MSLRHFAAPCLCHSLLLTSLLLAGSFSAHAADETLRKAIGGGTYEVTYGQQENALWIATSQSRSLDKDGAVYRLDLTTLDVTQTIRNGLKPFGAVINHTTDALWFGNTVDNTVTATDARTGAARGRLVLDKRQRSETVRPLQPCELVVNEQTNTVYITGLDKRDVIWVVDGAALKLKTTITDTGAMTTGLAIDPRAKRLYTTSADDELLIIDSESNTIISRKKLQDDGKAHFYLNLSLDTADHRAFITDSEQPEVLVVDTHDGKVLEKIAASGSLAVLFDPTCNEAYMMRRGAGKVNAIDGKHHKIVKTFKTPTHPSSLALSDDGKVLYVSVRQISSREKEATAPDDVIHIAL